MHHVVDTATKEMTDAAHHARRRQDAHRHPEGRFTSDLMDSIDRGVGQLVDADMNKESTRLQALQVQQQLGIQALSIANSNSQTILSLFRGNRSDSLTARLQVIGLALHRSAARLRFSFSLRAARATQLSIASH